MINPKALVGDPNEVDVGHEDKFELKVKIIIKEIHNDNQPILAVPGPAVPTPQTIMLVSWHSLC